MNSPPENRALDRAAGHQLPRRASLRRRRAPPRRRRRGRRSRRRPPSRPTATGRARRTRRSSRAATHMEKPLPDACAAPASSAATCSSRGTSPSRAPRRSPGACSTSATTPSAARRARARVHRHLDRGEPGAASSGAAIQGTFEVPLYLTGDGGARRALRPRRDGPPAAPGEPLRRDLHLQPARSSAVTGAGADEPLRARAPRRSERGERLARALDERDLQRRLLRDRLDRHGGGGRRRTRSPILQDLSQLRRRSPTGCSRGFLNFLFLGRLMSAPRRLREPPGLPGRRRARCSTPTSSTSTATARARSSAARSAPSRATSVAACSARRA